MLSELGVMVAGVSGPQLMLPAFDVTKKFTFAPALKPLPAMVKVSPTLTGDETQAITGAAAYVSSIGATMHIRNATAARSEMRRRIKRGLFVADMTFV
jgi:hypothetical protein